MNLIKKVFTTGALVASSLIGLVGTGCSPSVKSVRPVVSAGLNASRPIHSVKKIPKYMRDVPIHKDDSGVPGAIKDGANVYPLFDIALKPGARIETDVVSLDILGNFSLPLSRNLNRRNYTNHVGTEKRGEGAALTYYDVGYGPLVIPGVEVNACFPIKDTDFGVILGSSYREYKLNLQNGWDRYDKLEKRKDYTLGTIKETGLYTGVRFFPNRKKKGFFLELTGGVNLIDFESEKAIEVKYDDVTWRMGLFAGFKF